MYKEKQGKDLIDEAKKLGVSILGSYSGSSIQRPIQRNDIIQARVREAKRTKRESSLWIIALVSAVASVISALAAWFAALK